MKKRILSAVLALCLAASLFPVQAVAAQSDVTASVSANVEHSANETQITATIEAYLTDAQDKTREVKPCDIIFLIEQSAFMNTQSGTALYGQERAEILNAMRALLAGMPKPTTGEPHRVAIAGYGRINSAGDNYIESQHPGTLSRNNPSLNTGYYTNNNGVPEFHSARGWREWSSIDGNDESTLPEMPGEYLDDDAAYGDLFMTFDKAAEIIDPEEMVPWYAGAARMDAGLQITERLAQIASNHDASRDLIICIAASSLPYQNYGRYQKLRPDAAKAAAAVLKETYGAVIFGLGDFNKLNLDDPNLNDYASQRDNFNDTMASICGSNTESGADYFKGLSQVGSIDEALNELMTKIDASVGDGAVENIPVKVKVFGEKTLTHTWTTLKQEHHILQAENIKEIAVVEYFPFTEYEGNTPVFDMSTPSRRMEIALSEIGSGDAVDLSKLTALPIPPKTESGSVQGAPYGEMVRITITDPVCVDYEWVGRWRPDFNPPSHEHATRGTRHNPTAPTQNEQTEQMKKLKFAGWYRRWDPVADSGRAPDWTYGGIGYVRYGGTVFPAFGSDLVLYGRWLPYIDVNFHWTGSIIPDKGGAPLAPPSSVQLLLDDDGECFFTPGVEPSAEGYEFDGWYMDAACTEEYTDRVPLTANTDLYGRWVELGSTQVTFKIEGGYWDEDGEDSADRTVEIELRNGKGTLETDMVPEGMIHAAGYTTPGSWDIAAVGVQNITVTGPMTFTFRFPRAETCTVTYHWVSTENPENVTLPGPDTVSEDTTYSPKKPTGTYDAAVWTFSGWFTDPGLTDENKVDDPISVIQNMNLYGAWVHVPCTVKFRSDYFSPAKGYFGNGDGSEAFEQEYEIPYGSSMSAGDIWPPVPVAGDDTQWYFKDWELVEDDDDDLYHTTPYIRELIVKENLTFVAQWWPIVTFDADGGHWEASSGEDTRYVKVPAGTDRIEPLLPPIREGYTFLGWYDEDESLTDFSEIEGPKTVYAHWGENVTVTFKIVNGLWSAGGTDEDRTVSVVLNEMDEAGNACGTLPPSEVPQLMVPVPGFEGAAGGWDIQPNTEPGGIAGDVTYTYTFGVAPPPGGGDVGTPKTDITVRKEWKLDDGGRAADSVQVALLKDGAQYGVVTLGADNSWTHTWHDVDGSAAWTVAELSVPAGFTASVSESDGIFTIVNDDIAHSSGGPDEPDDSGRPVIPGGGSTGGSSDKLNTKDHYSYIIGYEDGTVQPYGTITRGEVATIFFRLLTDESRSKYWATTNGYSDVPADLWCNNAISTLSKMGIIDGFQDSTFQPYGKITRAQFAKIAVGFFETTAQEYGGYFSDVEPDAWYASYVEAAARVGLVNGFEDGMFHPEENITRAQACVIVNRALGRKPDQDRLLPEQEMLLWPDLGKDTWFYADMMEATNSHDYLWIGEGDAQIEEWTEKLPQRDWSAFEHQWADANAAPGGEVVKN